MSDTVTLEPQVKPIPNWDLAKQLYFNRVDQHTICNKARVSLAALRQRIYRQDWQSQRDQISQVVSVTVSESKPVAPASARVAELGDAVREDIVTAYQKVTRALKSLRAPKTLDGVTQWAAVLRDLCQPGKMLFGWGDTITSSLHIGLLKSAADSAKVLNANLTHSDGPTIEIPQQIAVEQRPIEPVTQSVEQPAG